MEPGAVQAPLRCCSLSRRREGREGEYGGQIGQTEVGVAVRVMRSLLVMSVTAASVLLVAPGAGASVPRAAAEVCEQVNAAYDAQPALSQLGGTDFDASSFKAAAAAFKSGAAVVPPDIKKAMTTMSKYYAKIGKARNASDALMKISARDTSKFTKAGIAFETFLSSECL